MLLPEFDTHKHQVRSLPIHRSFPFPVIHTMPTYHHVYVISAYRVISYTTLPIFVPSVPSTPTAQLMAQRAPPLAFPPLQSRASLPRPYAAQEAMSPFPHEMRRREGVSGREADLQACERWVRRYGGLGCDVVWDF